MKQNKNRIESMFYTASQVSKFLYIPLRTIYRLSEQGKLKSVKIGKHWRYARTDIEEYLSVGIDFSNMAPRRTNQFAERRACPRLNCYCKCLYQIYLPPVKEITSHVIIRNISASGALLIGMSKEELTKIDIGDPLKLDFAIGDNGGQETLIEVKARVVRKNHEGIGIKFRNIKEDYKNSIIEFVG